VSASARPIARLRADIEAEEAERLGPWAQLSRDSKGRLDAEEEPAHRTVFQRDRDRIVHSKGFRRLEYKTQVFIHHEGDHFRNRLTHTLEGAQIARTIARVLRLNEDLAEAVALAHDIGHTPFGHAGERVLARTMKGHGGFDHNRQTLRVVDLLERRVPERPGLNLTSETREGILKHGCHWEHPVPIPELGRQRPLESQVADVADEIAYMNHDLDDALRGGLIDFEQVRDWPLIGESLQQVADTSGTLADDLVQARAVSYTIDRLVKDVIEHSAATLAEEAPTSAAAPRAASRAWVGFSPPVFEQKRTLKRLLSEHVYHHPRVSQMTDLAEKVVEDLFGLYVREPDRLPEPVRLRFDAEGMPRAVADHVAGMTDRFAIEQHRALFGREAVGPFGDLVR
jgi:dGTPase